MNTTDPRALLATAKQAFVERRYHVAIDLIDRALQERKPPPEAHLWAGLIRFQIGDLPASLRHYDTYLAFLDLPDRLRAIGRYNRALTLDCAHRWQDAVADYESCLPVFQVLGLGEFTRMALQNLAWALCELGQYDAARTHLEAAEPLCEDEGARWRQRTALAFLATLRGDYDETQTFADAMEECDVPPDVQSIACGLVALALYRLGDEVGYRRYLAEAQRLMLADWDPRCRRVIDHVLRLIRAKDLM